MRLQEIEWCRAEQAAAREHMRHGKCDHPQCTTENNLRWLTDAFAEEILIELESA